MKTLLFIISVSLAAVFGISAAFGEDFSINIVFDVEADSATFAQGDPVAIFMTASNPKAMNAHYENLAAGKEVSGIPKVTLGTPAQPWTDSVRFAVTGPEGAPAAVGFYAPPAKEGVIALGAENAAEHYFFITPEETSKLKEGSYSVKAAIGGVTSNKLILNVVKKGEVPPGKGPSSRLLRLGRYHYLRGDFQEARGYAHKILATEPHSLRGLNLLGDALTGHKRYKEAYDTFNTAIDEFFIQYPPPKKHSANYRPPELFMHKRNELKKKL